MSLSNIRFFSRIVSSHKIPAAESENKPINKPLRLAPTDTTAPRLALCDNLRLKRGKLTFQIALLHLDFFAQRDKRLFTNVCDLDRFSPTRNSVPHCGIG